MVKELAIGSSVERIALPEGYTPSDTETYMNPQHLEYFRQKLTLWKNELQGDSRETLQHLREENWQESDTNDRASVETDAALELRTRGRYLKLINKIDQALARIAQGEYGYCDDTGEEIGLRRLEARPIATMTIEAQQRHENYERTHSEDDDA